VKRGILYPRRDWARKHNLTDIPINLDIQIDNHRYHAILFPDIHLSYDFELIITKEDRHSQISNMLFVLNQ